MRFFKYFLITVFVSGIVNIAQAANKDQPQAAIEDLGNQQYRIGPIQIDKKNKQFSVTGKIYRLLSPLEFLAASKGGQKRYESMIELDSSAHEFNLACILIGLDAKNAKPPKMHFDENSTMGDKVDITIEWQAAGKKISATPEQLLSGKGLKLKNANWNYTGSLLVPGGEFMAEVDGTIIGFVHDPSSIIEHQEGLGLGQYGLIGASKLAPPVGTRVTLSIRNSSAK